jgi:hypothetical protein
MTPHYGLAGALAMGDSADWWRVRHRAIAQGPRNAVAAGSIGVRIATENTMSPAESTTTAAMNTFAEG